MNNFIKERNQAFEETVIYDIKKNYRLRGIM